MSDWELFDLQNDPNELSDLYGVPGNENLIAKLKGKLEELREFYSVPSEITSVADSRAQLPWSIMRERNADAVNFDLR